MGAADQDARRHPDIGHPWAATGDVKESNRRPIPAPQLALSIDQLADWQARRLSATYAEARRLRHCRIFLERGFASFTRMGGATALLTTIHARETALMHAIFSGGRAAFPAPLD